MDGIIELKVNGNSIVKDSSIAGAQYEANSKKLRITFGDDWNGYGKRITFWNALGKNPVDLQLGTNLLEDIQVSQNVYIVPIPGEAMTEAGENTFVIQGYTDGVIKRSVGAKLRVLDSPIADDADIPSDVTPTEMTQIRAEIDSVIDDIVVVKQGVERVDEIIKYAENFLNEAEINAINAQWHREAIENMTVSSETLEVGAEPTVEKSTDNDIVNLHFGIPTSASGVYIGTEEPTDPNINVWVDTNGESESNDSKYFEIDNNGIVSLKSVYRGKGDKDEYPYSISDMGKGNKGSLIDELPERIVIPEVIGNTVVTGFQVGTFYKNHKIKELVIPNSVKSLPQRFCAYAVNLESVKNTEHVEFLGEGVFGYSKIRKALFPSLEKIEDVAAFYGCAYLHTVDIGNYVSKIPANTFMYCHSLSSVIGGENVKTIEKMAFAYTTKLKHLPLLSNGKIKSIGDRAFNYSRIEFDFKSLTNCEIETENAGISPTYPTQDETKDANGKYFWEYFKKFEGTLEDYLALTKSDPNYYTYFPIENRLGSYFNQKDPELNKEENKNILDSTYTYSANGCSLLTLMHIYSAIGDADGNVIEIVDPKDFEENILRPLYAISGNDGSDATKENYLTAHPSHGISTAVRYLYHKDNESIRYENYDNLPLCNLNLDKVTTMDKDGLRSIYYALALGGYIRLSVNTTSEEGPTSHSVMLYGVNDNGEVLVVDSGINTYQYDNVELIPYRMPVQNFTNPSTLINMIVPK